MQNKILKAVLQYNFNNITINSHISFSYKQAKLTEKITNHSKYKKKETKSKQLPSGNYLDLVHGTLGKWETICV